MKSFFTTILSVLCIIGVSAQKLENSNLWKIEGKGLAEASYLFGTMHITCDASLSSKITKALDETDQLVLELDMDDPQLQAAMMQQAMMKDGKVISEILNAEDYKALDEFLTKEIGVGLAVMNQMKPFLIQASLLPKMIDCPIQSFEAELMKVTHEQNEEVLGLETIQDQMKVFDDIPYEVQLKDLVRMAKDNMSYDKEMILEMIAQYQSEDIEAMLDMMNNENYSSVAEYQDILLDERNKKWIEKIEKYANSKPSFFGVGAGHLAGEQGVIQLLRAKGYTVTPVL
jgi:hypothetical protein